MAKEYTEADVGITYERPFGFCAIFFLVIFAFPLPALAYIDAGSGSMLLQLLLAGLAGAAVMIKLWWNRLKLLFRRKKDDQ